ncbi:uncharacterized protein [Ptychodera flava]|uniref:uncharacterized protein n=1 Tax=Ptychodera flava TaxID=63121 RepID=UPI003969BCF2
MVCEQKLNSRAITLVCLILLLPVLFGVGGWFTWIGMSDWDRYKGYFWFSIVLYAAGLWCLIGAIYLGIRYRNRFTQADYRDEAFEAHQRRKAAAQRGEEIPSNKKLLRDMI